MSDSLNVESLGAELPSLEPPSVEPPSVEPPSVEPPSVEPPSAEPPSPEQPSAGLPGAESPGAQSPNPPTWVIPERLTIHVGGRVFRTQSANLTDASGFLRSLLSCTWSNPLSEDGTLFLDDDGDVFEHLLNHMRTLWYPLFYNDGRFDYGLYGKLLQQADYYQVNDLKKWIEAKCFLKAVRVKTEVDVDTYDTARGSGRPTTIRGANQSTDFQASWRVRKEYKCPRRIAVHMGNPDSCGRQCQNAMPADGPEYQEIPICSFTSVTKDERVDYSVLKPSCEIPARGDDNHFRS